MTNKKIIELIKNAGYKETTPEEAFGDHTAFRIVFFMSEMWFKKK